MNTRQEIIDKRSDWKTYTPLFRIEAVIHDGQWYTKEKWRKVALEKNFDLLDEWIENHKDILITKEDSFRVSYDEVIRWYKEQNIPIETLLMPKNYAPRIWNNKTETETLLDSPRFKVASLMFASDNPKLLEKARKIVAPYGRLINHKDRSYVFSISGSFFKSLLMKHLSPDEIDQFYMRVRSDFNRRDVLDLDDEFLEKALDFYYSFALVSLRGHEKTLSIYLPNQDDRKAQIYEWILTALQKFDESQPIPFSGYLNKVLQVWPYDLPDLELGKPLAKFQRERSKAEQKLITEKETTRVSLTDIQELLSERYTKEEFYELEEQHQRWLSMKKLNDLTWEENGEDKPSESIFVDSQPEEVEFSHKITKALLSSAIKSEKYALGIKLIENLGSKDESLKQIGELPDSFKKILMEELYGK